jgi:hydrogenase nickel incorporation protein HypA/HybF
VHELGLALEVVEIVAERSRGARVKRVVLDVGVLTAVQPDALRFCFDLATEGTSVAGASLEIRENAAKARCRACGHVLELRRPFGTCACGVSDLDWLSGDELQIFEMEVE